MLLQEPGPEFFLFNLNILLDDNLKDIVHITWY